MALQICFWQQNGGVEPFQKKGSIMKKARPARLLALLLCIAMLFSVACAPSSHSDTAESSSDTANSNTPPENGARAIVGKTVKLYYTAENVQDIAVAHYEGTPEILLVDTQTACEKFVDGVLGEKWNFTYEETDTTLTITRDNGAYCVLDFVEDTLYFNNLDMFTTFGFSNMADMLENTFVDAEGNSFYFQRTGSVAVPGLPVLIHLAERNINLDIYEGKKYVPFQTFNDMILSPFLKAFAYNSQDLFSLCDGRLDPSLNDTFYSIEPAERSAALIEYTVTALKPS